MTRHPFDHVRLPNGLRLLGERTPARSVAVGIMVDAGARDEAPDESGVSHFLEHLAFKGDDRRDAEELNRAFDELGARYNAYTSHERTFYYGAVLPEQRAALTELLLTLLRPALRPEDVEVERQVILEEIAMYEDRPSAQAFERGAERFFAGHPLGSNVLGTRGSIMALTPERVRAYHGARYGCERLLLVVAGDYVWNEVVAQAAEATADWGQGGSRRVYPVFAPRRGAEEGRAPGFSRAHVTWFAPAPSAQDPDRWAAALLARVVGDGDNGRLFWALVEPGLVDEASLWFDPADGLGTFQAFASTDDDRHDEVVERFEATLDAFEREGPTDDEWARAQRGLATSVTLAAETPMGRLAGLADGWLDRGEVETAEATVRRILGTPREAGLDLLASAPLRARFRFGWRPLARS
jgi:predicted Zn-dependent peptidase